MESNGTGPEKPTLEQWAKLYEAAIWLKTMEPWRMLWDTDIITLGLPGRRELMYCSVMGNAGELYGVAIYPGAWAFNNYIRMAMLDGDTPPGMVFAEQKCLTLYFGDREDLHSKDREVIKDLGLKFRGRGEWVYFRSMEPGYYPWSLQAQEVELLTEALSNLYIACGYIINRELEVDFQAGQTLLRFYSDEQQEWLNSCVDMPEIRTEPTVLEVDDELAVARLKNRPMMDLVMEADMFYAPTAIQKSRNDRPHRPRVVMLADRQDGTIITHDMLEDSDDGNAGHHLLNMLANFVLSVGRPSDIYVRDERTSGLFADFCEKTSIKLHIGEGMHAINKAYRGIEEMITQQL